MRVILFRGKREDNGRLIQGDYQHFHIENDIYVYIGRWGEEMRSVKPETVGQFTGLTDKNGTKIFEGDIVTFPFDEFNPCAKFKIEWVGAEFCAVHIEGKPCVWTIRVTDYADQMDIIGNIHDNPELLEEV